MSVSIKVKHLHGAVLYTIISSDRSGFSLSVSCFISEQDGTENDGTFCNNQTDFLLSFPPISASVLLRNHKCTLIISNIFTKMFIASAQAAGIVYMHPDDMAVRLDIGLH